MYLERRVTVYKLDPFKHTSYYSLTPNGGSSSENNVFVLNSPVKVYNRHSTIGLGLSKAVLLMWVPDHTFILAKSYTSSQKSLAFTPRFVCTGLQHGNTKRADTNSNELGNKKNSTNSIIFSIL